MLGLLFQGEFLQVTSAELNLRFLAQGTFSLARATVTGPEPRPLCPGSSASGSPLQLGRAPVALHREFPGLCDLLSPPEVHKWQPQRWRRHGEQSSLPTPRKKAPEHPRQRSGWRPLGLAPASQAVPRRDL